MAAACPVPARSSRDGPAVDRRRDGVRDDQQADAPRQRDADVVADFTAATRAEPGNLFFRWSRSADDPTEWVLLEGFADAAAGEAHVRTPHFAQALEDLPGAIASTPQIIHVDTPSDGWGPMAELQPR